MSSSVMSLNVNFNRKDHNMVYTRIVHAARLWNLKEHHKLRRARAIFNIVKTA